MNFVSITAQLDPGNTNGSVFRRFKDSLLHTPIFAISNAAFSPTGCIQAQLPLGSGLGGFTPSGIAGWRIGDGSFDVFNIRMSLAHFTRFAPVLSAVPGPAAVPPPPS